LAEAARKPRPKPPGMKPGVRQYAPKDSPETREKVLDNLRAGMTLKDASEQAGVPRRTVCQWREDDPEFRKQIEAAYDEGTDVLEREAQRRAVEGTEHKFYDKEGNLVNSRVEYSDTLMIMLMKGRRPERYRDKSAVELTGKDGAPLNASLAIEFVAPAAKPKETK
jgi:hypothetical protein